MATPLVAFRPAAWLPPIVLPAEEVTVMVAPLLVTTLPWASCTRTTGSVASTPALGPPTGCLLIASLVAGPGTYVTVASVWVTSPLWTGLPFRVATKTPLPVAVGAVTVAV